MKRSGEAWGAECSQGIRKGKQTTPPLVLALVLLGAVLLATSCKKDDGSNPVGPPDTTLPDTTVYTLRVIAPGAFLPNIPYPVVVYDPEANPRSAGWVDVDLDASLEASAPLSMRMKRGAGSTLLIPGVEDSLTLDLLSPLGAIEGHHAAVRNDSMTVRNVSGVLAGPDLVWGPKEVIRIDNGATVNSGDVLHIEEGTVVLLGDLAPLRVAGQLTATGSDSLPILFSPMQADQPWGQIDGTDGSVNLSWTFLVGGGGDDSRAFGHSHSEPVIYLENASLTASHVFLLDNPGKALGSLNAEVSLDSCLISRCDTGGELQGTWLQASDSYFLDMPNDTPEEIDDDNDAIYLNSVKAGEERPSRLERCVFVTGKDDAIDHNGALVVIDGCVIEDFDNEGVAASNQRRIEVRNTLVMHCEQGIEAGYGSPEVVVDHCTLLENQTGLRWGDWYSGWDHDGTLTVTNTISVRNTLHNVWNYDPANGLPREGVVSVRYSIVNEADYNQGEGNLAGTVDFRDDYTLDPESIGAEAGSDSLDMGLLSLP